MKEIEIKHILHDGTIEDNGDSESRLMKLLKIPEQYLFMSKHELVGKAYDIQGDKIAFTDPENDQEK